MPKKAVDWYGDGYGNERSSRRRERERERERGLTSAGYVVSL
jgi:hypothetical protein